MSDYPSQPPPPSPDQPQPVAQQVPRNGLGMAGLIFGTIGVLSGLIAFLFWLAGILGITGVLGIIGLILGLAGYARFQRGEATNETIALWGTFISALAMILSIVGVVIFVGMSADADGEPSVETEGAASPVAENTGSPHVETSAPARAEQTAPIEPEVDVVDLKVGDCLAEIEYTEEIFISVETVACTEPHSDEIFATVNLPEGDGQFPGFNAIEAQAEELCIAEFEGFIGRSYEESVLDIAFFTPDEEGWRAGDRLILCTVYDPAGDTTGTLAGANR